MLKVIIQGIKQFWFNLKQFFQGREENMLHSGEQMRERQHWSMLTKPTNLSAAGSSLLLINTRWLHCTEWNSAVRSRTSSELQWDVGWRDVIRQNYCFSCKLSVPSEVSTVAESPLVELHSISTVNLRNKTTEAVRERKKISFL